MTFKHVKFTDSPTMRALEKVAHEKGWVKPEPLTKTAAKKTSLEPTSNLMANVLKLCAGLRSQSMEKYADELETSYLNYKRVQTMYDAHGEKGEDVIEFAHPKGSHKLENVDSSEAVFEDILDKHVKILQVVEKKPSGKLSDASQIISAVKMVFAQDKKDQLSEAIESRVGVVREKLGEVLRRAGPEVLGSGEGVLGHLFTDMGGWKGGMTWEQGLHFLTKNPNLDTLMMLQDFIGSLESRLRPGLLGSGATQQSWIQVKGLLNQCKPLVRDAIAMSKEWNEMIGQEEEKVGDPTREPTSFQRDVPSAPAASGAGAQLFQLFNDITQNVGTYKSQVQTKGLPNEAALAAWLDKAEGLAKQYVAAYSKAPTPANLQTLVAKMNGVKAKLDNFQKKYVA